MFLEEEKFSSRRKISNVILDHDIPSALFLNIDHTPLFCVSPGKYIFSSKGSKNVSIKGLDDKREIAATFVVSATGYFLPIQLIYQGKSKRSSPKFTFLSNFHVTFTPNHWSNLEKCKDVFKVNIFPYLSAKKKELGYPEDQRSLIILDTFKGKGNEEMKQLCAKNSCELVIVPHNLTNKFQPLDISFNQSAKKFISNKFNAWYADRVSKQLSNGVAPGDVKVSLKLSDLKPLHVRGIVETYDHLKHQNDSIVKGFDAAGISDAIICANDVFTRVENSFDEQRQQQCF